MKRCRRIEANATSVARMSVGRTWVEGVLGGYVSWLLGVGMGMGVYGRLEEEEPEEKGKRGVW